MKILDASQLPFGFVAFWDMTMQHWDMMNENYLSQLPFGFVAFWDQHRGPHRRGAQDGRLNCLSALSPFGTFLRVKKIILYIE